MTAVLPVIYIALFFLVYFHKEERDTQGALCSLILGMGLLFESAFSFFFYYLPFLYLCGVAIVTDGLVALAVLKTRFENRVFIAVLGAIAITLTFMVGAQDTFPHYRIFIDTLIAFQLLGIVVRFNGQRRILGSFTYLRGGKQQPDS